MRHTSIYFISIFLLLPIWLFGQNDSIANDTLRYQQKYGLRLGGDIGKLARTFFEDDYTGFEIVGDYRLTQNLYLAGEIGTEERTTINEYLDVTTTGSYFKAGIDYNFYTNWLDMDNMIYCGLRTGVSSFKHELNAFTIYKTDRYFIDDVVIDNGEEFKGLSAIWGEFIVGLKAEIFNNFYMGLNIQFKGLIVEDEPSNFENLYIPGYNRTYDSGSFGFGYGYTLAYRLPLYKKDKRN